MIKTKRKPGECGNPVSAMRCWEVERVSMECPHCGREVTARPTELYEEILWFGEEFEQECPDCGQCFWAEVDDDDR